MLYNQQGMVPIGDWRIHLGKAEVKALGVLAEAGLVPPLRFSLPGSTVLPGARAWMRQSLPDTKAS